jgi:PTS system nitrogen regulatory IIA component
MQLNVKDVAKLLNVNEKTIYRWLQKGTLPAYLVGNQYRFNKAELLEWATSRQIGVSTDLFQDSGNGHDNIHSLSEALKLGGIYYRIEGNDKETALKSVVGLMRLPEEVDRNFLLQVLLAREAIASTAVGDGIAIPHVRNPIVLHVNEPIVSLCFLERPIDFGSLDGKPVNCLFTLVSPTVKAHLYLLSRLAFALRDNGFRTIIEKQGSREEIFSEINKVEAGIKQGQPVLEAGGQG